MLQTGDVRREALAPAISGCRILPPRLADQIIMTNTTKASASNAAIIRVGIAIVLRNLMSAPKEKAPSVSMAPKAKSATLERW